MFATNGSLVEKAVKLIEMLGTKVARPDEGRAILGLKNEDQNCRHRRNRIDRRGAGPRGFCYRGYNVIAFDVSPTAEARLKAQIKTAWPSLEALLGKTVKKGKLTFTLIQGDGIEGRLLT